MEEQFLQFSRGLGVKASELDALIWLEMMASPATVHRILDETGRGPAKPTKLVSKSRSKNRHADSGQMALLG
ncbi:hypothetical protein D3C84_1140750 [compost metagenome]